MQGLRIQDTREISPWDILEGVKNSGPLMLSWFGAVRMKRKPLRYVDQRRLVHFHTHQKRFGDMMEKRHYVSLPDPVPVADVSDITSTEVDGKPSGDVAMQPQELPQRPTDPSSANAVVSTPKPNAPLPQMVQANHGPRQTMMQPAQPGTWSHSMPMHPQPSAHSHVHMQSTLRKIQKEQIERSRIAVAYHQMRPSYPSNMTAQMHPQRPNVVSYGPSGMMRQRLQMQMQAMTPEQRQMYVQRVRLQQAQRQHQQHVMNSQMMAGQPYNQQFQQQMPHPQMMQAAPPMQPMQHGYGQQMMVRAQFPQQPGGPMNPMQRPMY